jgi:coproporphyrinogen III oxidase
MIAGLSERRRSAAALVGTLQERMCAMVIALEQRIAERAGDRTAAEFAVDAWENGGRDGGIRGSGSTRVIANGAVFEKGGVNTSIVCGTKLPPSLIEQRPDLKGHAFFAAGVSVVLHPANPNVPTAHCNYRYFESEAPDGTPGAWWFGGGADLTPYYPFLDDVRHDARFYPAFKAWCDRYFYLKHRAETRGVGGIFYDYLDADGFGEWDQRTAFGEAQTFEGTLAFMADAGGAFADAYLPLVERHAFDPFGERERSFQLLRRGRYVEFNLIYDRGTHFGLQSGGRIESILMSLPPLVRWEYDARPEPGSPEAQLAEYLRPRDWFGENPLQS